MNWKSISTLLCIITFLVIACTPKTTETVAKTEEEVSVPQTPQPAKPADPCATFDDNPDPMQIKRDYVLYRDFLKAEDWDRAYDYWQRVYKKAPAADGKRNTVFSDGITFYEHFKEQATDSLEKEKYVKRIFGLYEQIDKCFPESGYGVARKGFDLYYNYPHMASRKEIYDLLKQAIDKNGEETPDFVINPFSALLVELYFNDEIPVEEAKEYQQKVRDIIKYGLEECEGVGCERWEIVNSYAPQRLEAFEVVRGFYECEYYMDKYYQDFLDNPEDCDIIRTTFSRLRFGGCDEAEARFAALIEAGNQNCRSGSGPLRLAYEALQNAEYEESISKFKEAIEATDDNEKKASYLMLIAKIYNAHLKNFPESRRYALKAAEVKPNWGEPYILIGRLYASSGPLCGPGRGWDSQIVVWPAIDMWSKAKQVDPSVAREANKWINQYAQYMPARSEIFQRSLREGQSFRVGCWIQRTTTIRAAK